MGSYFMGPVPSQTCVHLPTCPDISNCTFDDQMHELVQPAAATVNYPEGYKIDSSIFVYVFVFVCVCVVHVLPSYIYTVKLSRYEIKLMSSIYIFAQMQYQNK